MQPTSAQNAPPRSPATGEPTAPPAHETSAIDWFVRALVYPMFFASGAAGLIYEVTWTRQLLYTFGAGLYAVCAVLVAFMAGLALGAWALGRVADRLRRPLMAYGALELAVAVCGAVLPFILSGLHVVDAWAYHSFGQNFAALTAVRLCLALGAMIIPTTLMGATLPVLTRFLVRSSRHIGMHIGGLYAINTFGAVSGAFAAGFILIGRYGLHETQWLAAALNAAVGLVSVLLALGLDRGRGAAEPTAPARDSKVMGGKKAAAAKKKTSARAARPAAPPRSGLVRWVLLTAMLSGVVSLAAQVLWTRTLVFSFEYLKNTTYSFSAMLTVFLTGLALGSALIGLVIDHMRGLLRLYGLLLTLIGVAIVVSVLVTVSGGEAMKLANPQDPATGGINWILAVTNIMLQTVGVLGVPTLLMGMAFPLAARLVSRMGSLAGDVGLVYSLNTLGAIVGSLAAAFVIVPLVGLTHGLLLLGAADMLLGLITIAQAPSGMRTLKVLAPLALVIFGLVFVLTSGPSAARLQPVETNQKSDFPFYEEGPLATVAVVENDLAERTIYVDGVGVAGTDEILQTDQKSLAHVPMALLDRPSAALTVGFGSGGASYSLLLHDRLTRVDCVEICPTVTEAAPALTAANHDFFGKLLPIPFARQSDRYSIILDDARAYLRYTQQRYDFIATDCTDLRYKSNANLYDIEYFQACRDRLTSDGIVVVWMPLGGLSEDVFKVALRTFHTVFPAMGVFFMDNAPTHYILLVGWQDKVHLDYRLFQQTLAEPDVREDLAELKLDDPVKLLSCFITGGDALTKYLGEGPINTEDHPLIEFESPKYGYGDKPLINNLAALMKVRVSPMEFMEPGSIPAEEATRLKRYEAALPSVIEGLQHYRDINGEGMYPAMEGATRAWVRALEMAPEDLSVKSLLQFPIISQRMEQQPDNPFWAMLLGRVYMLQPDSIKQTLARAALDRARTLLAAEIARAGRQPAGAGKTQPPVDVTELRAQLTTVQNWLSQLPQN